MPVPGVVSGAMCGEGCWVHPSSAGKGAVIIELMGAGDGELGLCHTLASLIRPTSSFHKRENRAGWLSNSPTVTTNSYRWES